MRLSFRRLIYEFPLIEQTIRMTNPPFLISGLLVVVGGLVTDYLYGPREGGLSRVLNVNDINPTHPTRRIFAL